MPTPLGSICLVLHGHLPYVLHHGTAPHGEAWLYEAAAETYLPLLDLISDIVRHRGQPGLTIGLTPVLLEQLADDQFKSGFADYLHERIGRAKSDRAEFEKKGQEPFTLMADRWEKYYQRQLAHFEKIGRDIVGQFARHWEAGYVQMLTSNATHAYLPLMVSDECIAAQLSAGTKTSERHLGRKSRGFWLPECAYRPADPQWTPAVLWSDPRHRPGIETYLANAGVDHFFVDSHAVTRATPIGAIDDGVVHAVHASQAHWDTHRGWLSPMNGVGVGHAPQRPKCVAFARHPGVSEQVWSSVVGYPAAGEYLEFHRRHGYGGLRYHRITGLNVDLAHKRHYAPEEAFLQLYRDSQHFCKSVREILAEHQRQTGRPGVVVAPFDAELFGHWWHEGFSFLRNILSIFARDKSVAVLTAEQALAQHPPTTVVRPPEGSWGKDGNHRVWLNDQTRWMWEIEYRAESRMLGLVRTLPWRQSAAVRAVLERAARELLLLQASDWPFAIEGKAAIDYAIQRFSGHSTRFDRMAGIAECVNTGAPITPRQQVQIDEVDAHDVIFKQIDLGWWQA